MYVQMYVCVCVIIAPNLNQATSSIKAEVN